MQLELKADLAIDDTGAITGIAWPFGIPDSVGDMIHKGAFGTPGDLPMLHEHKRSDVLGVWHSITETDRGLEVKGQLLINDVQRAREIHALVKARAITGLSIGFNKTKSTPRANRGRDIKSLSLHEISLVAVPCHGGARINSFKSDDHSAIVELLSRATATYRNH